MDTIIDKELMITDISELENDVEYYMDFLDLKELNGLYKLKYKLKFKLDYCLHHIKPCICRMVKIDGKTQCILILYYSINVIIDTVELNDLGIFSMGNTMSTCNIYKMPPTDYILK